MVRMIITRYKDGEDFTMGKFILLNEKEEVIQEGYTLEPAGPDTLASGQNKRIPIGLYETYYRVSPKYKYGTPLLYNENVPHNRFILIHIGNYAEDTSGCILVGNKAGKESVLDSRNCFLELNKNIKNKQFMVDIR